MSEHNQDFIIIIPARYESTRLPGKPLLKIGDKTLIEHVCDNALLSQANRVIVATDDHRIETHLTGSQATVVMTSPDCKSGTDRIAQTASILDIHNETVVVNLQGDEPFMPPAVINQIALALVKNPHVQMSTGCENLENKNEWNNPNIVKVTRDKNDLALYFSRSLIPYGADDRNQQVFRHLGIYAYRVGYIKTFASQNPCTLERTENLEQLRALYNGDRIIVTEIKQPTGIGVDTPDDLDAARKFYGHS